MARIYWLLGSATDREADAAIALSHELPDSWSIVCNKMLWTPYARRFELDMVVVGDHGVYIIDEKSWRSPVKCGPEWWTIASGKAVRNPLNKAENAAAVLGTTLTSDVPALRGAVSGGMLVHAFVLFSRPGIDLDVDQCPAADRILRMEQAASLLKSFDAYRGKKGTDLTAHRDGIVSYLLGEQERGLIPEPLGVPKSLDVDPASAGNAADMDSAEPRTLTGSHRSHRPMWFTLFAIAVLAVGIVAALAWRSGSNEGGSPPGPSLSPLAVVWQDAHNHVGDYAVVEGPVMDVERSPMNVDIANIYLNVGKVFVRGQAPDPTRFYFYVPSEYDETFRAEVRVLPGNPTTPGKAYSGHVVCVTGRIAETARGEPFIEVHSTSAISLVD